MSVAILLISAAGLAVAFRGGPGVAQASGPLSNPAVTPTPTTCIPKGAALTLVAKNTSYETGCLAAPAHSALTVSFDNQDAGITHEFHILTASPTSDPNARTLFVGKILTGRRASLTTVGPLPPGTYYFQCDVHRRL